MTSRGSFGCAEKHAGGGALGADIVALPLFGREARTLPYDVITVRLLGGLTMLEPAS